MSKFEIYVCDRGLFIPKDMARPFAEDMLERFERLGWME